MKQLIQRSHSVWIVPLALTLVGFGPGATKAIAQTTYPFNAEYDLVVETEEIAPGISRVTVVGESANAPYDLTNLMSMNYAQLDPDTGLSTSGPDATPFGLTGLPILTDTLFGSGEDSLIGTSTTTAVLDFENLIGTASGTLTITDGSGRFSGATGTLSLTDSYTLSPDPNAALIGQTFVTGSIQVVPEPGTEIGTLLGIGAISTGVLLRRRRYRPTSG